MLSLLRLWLGIRSSVTEVLWAEDGLFPLCIHKAGFWSCVADPFAGYWLFLPRVLALPISILPWEYWALTSNVTAAVLLGIVSAFTVAILRRAGMGWYVSTAAGLVPALAPMVGLEAINAIGSSYMLLLFLATLAVAFPARDGRGVPTAVLLVITALTIPSTVVLLPLIIAVALRSRVRWRTAGLWIAAAVLGLAGQAWVALGAEAPRSVSFGVDTVNAWADAVPVSILTYWPGISLGEYSFFDNFTLRPLSFTGWLVVALLLGWGLWALARGQGRVCAVGVLVVAGLGLGLVPAAIGFPNNRYFVVPLLLWGVALLVALDPTIRRARRWVVALVTVLVLLVWWPAMPASWFRSTPQPAWTAEVQRIEAKCVAEPDALERPLFSPFWPPNWGDGLTEPTHPNLPCTIVWRWID
jgi:hypothetical protein